jgi:hypothetical protein
VVKHCADAVHMRVLGTLVGRHLCKFMSFITDSSAGLALFAAHAVLDGFPDASRACSRAIGVTALPSELTTSFEFCFEHARMLAHGAGPSLGATGGAPDNFLQMQLMKKQTSRLMQNLF